MTPIRRTLSGILVAFLVSLAAPATAAPPERGFYLGLTAGGQAAPGGLSLGEPAKLATVGEPGGSALVGLRAGLQVWKWLALEGTADLIPLRSTGQDTFLGQRFGWNALISPWHTALQPYLAVGTGLYRTAGGPVGDDTDYEIHGGLGLRGMLTERSDARIEALVLVPAGERDIEPVFAFQLGLDWWLCRKAGPAPPPPPPACPGGAEPDEDGECPPPDADGDGIPDDDDACPEEPGVEAFGGCPDSDGDGIPDKDDACPEEPGPQATGGCPDGDGDGIADKDDACPAVAGLAAFDGCPDADGDGVPEPPDKCPTELGVGMPDGCPAEEVRRFTGTIEGILFATGSAKIRKQSFKKLDEAADVLLAFPQVRLRIEGHTDDRGKDESNMKLSQARADSVKAYLVGKGVGEDRLEAVGYGETRPKAPNDTAAGRTQNRRIEFTLLR